MHRGPVRHPQGAGAGSVCDEFVYTVDVPATVIATAGAAHVGGLDGQSLLPLIEGGDGFTSREYLTCRYGNSVWYKDRRTWFFGAVDFQNARLFDIETDEACRHNIANRAADRIAQAKDRIMADAGGRLPKYTRLGATDAIGRPAFAEGDGE